MNKLSRSRTVSCLLLCLLLALALLPAAAQAVEPETVKVGFFSFHGYHDMDAGGNCSGYGYELLERIAGYAGLKYEFVGYDKSWSETQDMLERGEIDLVTSAQKTPEREAKFDFSDKSIGFSSAILTVKAGNARYVQEDYAHWSGMRVGLIKGNSRNDDLAAFAAENGFTYESVFFPGVDALVSALSSGAVDAILTSNLRHIEGEWILAEFDSSPFYIMVRKGDDALLSRIDAALSEFERSEPGFRTELMARYFGGSDEGAPIFTVKERAFVAENAGRTFKAVLMPDRHPYSAIENGASCGILAGLAKRITERSGLNITIEPVESREGYAQCIASGEAEICFDMPYDLAAAERDGCWLTEPYVSVPIARLHRETTYEYRTAAVIQNSNISKKYAPVLAAEGVLVTEYATVEDAVKAVMDRKADMALLYMATAEHAVWDDATSSLAAEEYPFFAMAFSVGVNADSDSLLYSILSKSAASIGEADVEAVSKLYAVTGEKKIDLIGYCYNHPLHALLTAMALILIAALAAWLFRSSAWRRRATARAEEDRRQAALLKDALAAAEQAGEAKSQFLSRVSHEMRTPLNAIIGFLSLTKDANPREVEAYLHNSEIAAKQLVSVINDVLDMSSIESGKMKIANAPFDFKQLIYSITNIYVTQCHDKGIEYDTKLLTPTAEWLIGDQLRVNQILINLLGNAVKFTSKGGVRLSISQTQGSGDHVFLRFEITDTGCGMSEETIKRLFQPFEQGDAATAQKYGGSGLGLSIVKNLVGLMDGAVRVESKLGVGSTFTVDLPFGKCEAHSDLPPIKGVETLRVLAVDDDEAERDYVSIVLKRIGVRFTCVSNGDEALAELERSHAENDPFNICLIDWKMPTMDGAETTRRVRARYGKDVIVIVVSAYDHAQADESAKRAGANLFIAKPLFQSSLFDLFMTLTGGRMKAQKGAAGVQHFSGRRILLAEDNEMNRMVAGAILKQMGIEFDEAFDGQICCDMFSKSEPGCYSAILMDMQMPNVDGMQATRMIRALSRPDAKQIHIIALTANAFNEDITRALSAGMNAHVAKPIETEELTRALTDAFGACGENGIHQSPPPDGGAPAQ